MKWTLRTCQATPNQGPTPVPEGETFVAIIRKGPHLASFTFAATEEEAETKAEGFIAAEDAKAAKRPAPKKKTAPATPALAPAPESEDIEEAI